MSDENNKQPSGMQYMKLTDIKPLENNPRIIKDEDMKRLRKSITDNPDFFEARPIICSDRTGELVIIGGNMRYRAAELNGLTEVPVYVIHGLTEEREKELIIRDNVNNGKFDWDILANEWEIDDLKAWGVDGIPKFETDEDVIENASLGSVKDFDEDTTYDEESFVREQINPDIMADIDECVARGTVRPSVAECLKKRAEQCTIFNFDQLTKFYRSDDPSDDEKRLLRRLYLVFEVPKKLFDEGILKLNKFSQEIYDDELTSKES